MGPIGDAGRAVGRIAGLFSAGDKAAGTLKATGGAIDNLEDSPLKTFLKQGSDEADKNVADLRRVAEEMDEAAEAFNNSIKEYTGNKYYPIRQAQSQGIAAFDDVETYHEMIAHADIIEECLESLPPYQGDIYRGIRLDSLNEFSGISGIPKVGDIFNTDALQSFSALRDIHFVQNRNTVLHVVNNQSGSLIDYLSSVPREIEVLVPSDVTYRIVDIRYNLPRVIAYETLMEDNGS